MNDFIQKIVIRKIILFLSTFFFYKKIRIKKFKNFKIILDIREYTENAIYFFDYDKEVRSYLKKITTGNENFIDIGAHIGFYSLFFSKILKKGKIFSFEPCKKNFDKLKKNIKKNNFKNIKIYNYAIGAHNGFANLIKGPFNNDGGNYISKEKNINGKKVKIFKLDKIYTNYKKKLIVKIDVEGFEEQVLKGMKMILQNINATLIIETGNTKNELIKYLKKFNYVLIKEFGINSIFIKKI